MTRFAVATALALLASPAAASSLLIASNNTCHAYGCETWATVTGLLDGAFDVVTVVDDFTDLDLHHAAS